MKIELDNNSFWATVVSVICLAVVAITVCSSYYYTRRMEAAFNAGYVEATTQGTSILVWTKK